METRQTSLKPSPRHDHVFAILRFDTQADETLPLALRITVTKVVYDGAVAEAEVRRLNELNADKGAYYFTQVTRLERTAIEEPLAGTSTV